MSYNFKYLYLLIANKPLFWNLILKDWNTSNNIML